VAGKEKLKLLTNRSYLSYILFVLCLAFASVSFAISFGDIKVYSYLDEPLSAELELTGLDSISSGQLQVNLASPNDFVRAGIARPFILNNLSFDIIAYDNRVFIYIRSNKVVTTPFLEFLIELSWPEGSVIKGYTILIDPPPKNLNTATRPIAFSEAAIQQQEVKKFGEDNPIENQKVAEQLLVSGSTNEVVIKSKKTDQKTFQDESVPNLPTKHSSAEGKSELVPAVVPDVTEEGSTATQPVAQQAKPIPAAEPLPIAPEATESMAVPSNTTIITTKTTSSSQPVSPTPEQSPAAPITTAAPPVAAETTSSTKAAAIKSEETASNSETNSHTANAEDINDSFDHAVQNIKAIETKINPPKDLKHLTEQRAKHLAMFKDTSSLPVNDQDQIDFGEVLKPATAGADVKPKGAFLGSGQPGAPGITPASTVTIPGGAPGSSHNGIILLLAGFALGLVGAAGYLFKTGLYRKYLPHKHHDNYVSPEEDNIFSEELEAELNGIPGDNSVHEEIELSSVDQTVPDEHLDMAAFEAELDKLDLDNFASSKTKLAPPPQTKTIADILNIGGDAASTSTQVKAEVLFPPIEIAETPKEESKEQAKQTSTEDLNIATEKPLETVMPTVNSTIEMTSFESDFGTMTFTPSVEANLTTEPKPVIATATESVQTADQFLASASSIPVTPTLVNPPDVVTTSGPAITLESNKEDIKPEVKTETTNSQPEIKTELKLESQTDVKQESKPETQPEPKSTEKLEEKAAEKSKIEPLLESPSIDRFMTSGTELRLEPEGVAMLSQTDEAISLKFRLIKQYLDADDKESARLLLAEILEIGNDAQKLEAQILLSGIL
jgi:FimV-like protein